MIGFAGWVPWGADGKGLRRGNVRCSAEREDVVIVGAGVSGLAAAKLISEGRSDLSMTILEKSDDVGGRIRSDVVDGYILDRGFQVFIEAYPQQGELLDYEQLDLKPFLPGALVYCEGAHHLVSDPLRRIQDTPESLVSPVGTFMDKARVALLRTKIANLPLDRILQRDECTTAEYLRKEGFTSSMIDRFFSPFYQGIFLAPLEEQSSRMFEYVFRMFLSAPASLPSKGIGAVTQHLAAPSKDKIQLNTGVKSISMNESGGGTVETEDGQRIEAKVIVVAADPPTASALLGDRIEPTKPRGCASLYFASDQPPPISKPILFLNGEGRSAGVVGNTCFPSSVSASYAPEGKTLVSTTVIGDDIHRSEAELERLVKSHMTEWWGSDHVNQWTHLRTYKIPYSQNAQNVPFSASKGVEVRTTWNRLSLMCVALA
mmetsp:Transcript_39679/g.157826  ORF Transcript_39679/g.157826 Transcript_39679/m.157826 type:complete len:431 (-) Transcript_39679:2422-3714(-)